MTDDAQPQFGFPIGRWHWWFAWCPVCTFDGRWIWLRKVKRRRIQKHDYLSGPPMDWWQYRYDKGYADILPSSKPKQEAMEL